jgi:hypothetical protein
LRGLGEASSLRLDRSEIFFERIWGLDEEEARGGWNLYTGKGPQEGGSVP